MKGEWNKMWEVTTWDKRFLGVDKHMQPNVIKYHYYLASELADLECVEGDIRILYTTDKEAYVNSKDVIGNVAEGEVVTIPWGGNVCIKYYKGKFVTADNRIATSNNTNYLDNKFLYYWMLSQKEEIGKMYRGAGIQHPSMMSVLSMRIPLPTLAEQARIVGILDTFSASIENLKEQIAQRRKQYEHYRDKLLDLEGKEGVEMKTLGEVGDICMCKRILKEQTTNNNDDIPFFKIGTFGGIADAFISKELFEEYKTKYSYPKKGEILISAAGTIGRSVVFDGKEAYFQDSNIVWIANNEKLVTNRFLYYFYQIAEWKTDGGTIKRLYNYNLKNTPIPLPSLQEQSRIVSILDTFEASIANLEAQLKERQKQYEYYRNKLLTFEE